MTRRLVLGLTFVAVLLSASFALAIEVKLTVADSANVARTADVVTTGIPFAKGIVQRAEWLGLSVGGRHVPAQFINTVQWPDGSVRWALMDCQLDVPARGTTDIVVSDYVKFTGVGRGPLPPSPVKVAEGTYGVTVSTGPLDFTIAKTPFESIRIDKKELVHHGGKGLVLTTAGGAEVVANPPTEIKVEQAGPMRALVCARGTFPGVHNNLLRYTVRVTAYAGQKFLKLQVWLENDGRYGFVGKGEWFNFDGLAVDLGLLLGPKVAASCEGASAENDLKVEQSCPDHRYAGMKYAVTSGARELKAGARTDGVVTLSGENGKLTVAVRHFWQNYEKAVEVAGGSALKLWLWPTDGEWPRSRVRRGDSCGEFNEFRKPGLYALPGGVHKGADIILDFSGRDPAASAATLNAPLMAQAAPTYYAETEAAPGLFAPADFKSGKPEYDARLANWNRQAHNAIDTKEPTSLYAARNGIGDGRGFWYGWMDFGDLLWEPGTSQLHYDWTWMMLLNWMRQGDGGFFDIAVEMARHRMEVDHCWSSREADFFRGLTHYEKQYTDIHGGVNDGHYKPIPSHNWISGVALYYMLTGEPAAMECVLSNAQGIRSRQVKPFQAKPGPGDQLRSTGWSILALCHIYDVTADKQWLDDAMILFNNNVVEKWKASGPYMDKGLQYYYSVLGFTELHRRTGDPNVLKLMKEGCDDGSFTDQYAEWQIHLSNLYAYVGYVTKNDAFIKKAEELFISYAPKNPNPACYTSNGAWTKETGKMIRNGHVLQYVEWKLKK